MNHFTMFGALLLPVCLAAPAVAQIQIPINVKSTFYRTSNDASAVPAAAIPLSALGSGAGQWLHITTTGAFANNGSADNQKNLVCVFSSGPVLLADGVVARVPGAIAAGTWFVSANTSYSNLPTDIPQDFVVSNSQTNGTIVRVPPGATHIFYAIADNHYSGNTDANNDYAVVFSQGVPATMQGTFEDVELRTGISNLPTVTPDIKPAAAFTTIYAEIHQRYGVSNGLYYVFAFDVYPTGGVPPFEVLPGIHVGPNFAAVQVGIVTATPAQWSVFVPPGFGGGTVILQGAFLSNTCRNGLVEASDAHQIPLL
jgi:hypothetical protein